MIADRKDTGPLLEMENVSVHFPVKGPYPFSRKRWLQAVTDVSLAIPEGETFGIVGESGCGKTTLANAMIGMVRPTQGTVRFGGGSLLAEASRIQGGPARDADDLPGSLFLAESQVHCL